ncbi:alkene reductase [Chroococcidiopsis sp.]|uniref:alkene reductase n=1 Tax=Chroococcidiopsis sp. TaxID=3088168 RepID=UPI003F3BB76B
MKTLFTPIHVGNLTLPNRIIMPPLTRNRAGVKGIPNELNAEYYAQRATAGLIVAEGTYPHPTGRAYTGQPGIYTDEQVAGWRLVTDAVHQAGGRIFLQLHHGGRLTHSSLLPNGVLPVAPSAVRPKGKAHTSFGKADYETPRALELAEIPQVVEMFRYATERAVVAGFDGVELHGANGYLPHLFLSNLTNLRTDKYGGSVENRTRFFLEVVKAMVSINGGNYVGVKVSPWKFLPNDIEEIDTEAIYPYLAKQLSLLGLAYLHVQLPIVTFDNQPDAPFDLAKLIRPNFQGVMMVDGSLDREKAIARIESGDTDLVAFGRAFLANPDLIERLRIDAPLNQVDYNTFYTPGTQGYTDYPTLQQLNAA